MKKLKHFKNIPQVIIVIYLLILLVASFYIDMSFSGIINDLLVKWAMNGVIVLSLIPMINVGAGRNFGMSIGLSAGLIGMIVALEYRMESWAGFFTSIVVGVLVAVVFGFIYSLILNRLKGNEEIVGTFAGFSFIPIMNIFYTFVPVTNRQMLYPIGGQGLRPKVNLEPYFGKILENTIILEIGNIKIPFLLLLTYAFIALIIAWFFKTIYGKNFLVISKNRLFATLSGLSVNKYRVVGIILSSCLAAVGVVIYTQSYGFLHLYDGPFMMSFPAISAIVIGGATKNKATVGNALLGSFLYQATTLLSVPVANALLLPEMSELMRVLITNSIILYAFIFEGGLKRETDK